MPDRRDALCAAAELILAIENAARTSGAVDTVATVGICEVFPGAVNSIPSRVRLSVDIRDTDLERRDAVIQAMERAGQAIRRKARSFHSNGTVERGCAGRLRSRDCRSAFGVCRKHRQNFIPMVSRAYHDSLFMSRIAPTAMLFIPCRNGYSHGPTNMPLPKILHAERWCSRRLWLLSRWLILKFALTVWPRSGFLHNPA